MNAKLALVDDHPLMRKGLVATLEADPDVQIVAQLSSAEEAMEQLGDLKTAPGLDLLIVDISLPGMSGLELVKHVQAAHPEVKVLVVSRHDESLYAERAVRAGAKGYVMKLEAGDVLAKAVRRILGGGMYVSDEVSERMLMSVAAGQAPAASPLEALSDRELEVFELTGKGQTTRAIAERLHLSVKTVESYRARIKDKLGLKNAAELMQHAVQWVESDGA